MERFWYPFLVGDKSGSLLHTHDRKDIIKNKKLIVSRDTQAGGKEFTLFNSVYKFAEYQSDVQVRNFYEVVLGEQRQKPRFDLDMTLSDPDDVEASNEWDRCLEALVDAITQIVPVSVNSLLLYRSDGKDKRSSHLIVDGYYHRNNTEAKRFYELVIARVPDKYRKWIDSSVYSSIQQFRIAGSQKLKSERVKTLSNWTYHSQTIDYQYKRTPGFPNNDRHRVILELEASLLGWTPDCKLLTLPVEQQDLPCSDTPRYPVDKDFAKEQLHPDRAKEAMKLCPGPFRLSKVIDNMIILKRLKPSLCPTCQRNHEHENPYLTVSRSGSVFFHCRRTPGGQTVEKSNRLGCISPIEEFSDDEEQLEDIVPPCHTVTKSTCDRGQQCRTTNSLANRYAKGANRTVKARIPLEPYIDRMKTVDMEPTEFTGSNRR